MRICKNCGQKFIPKRRNSINCWSRECFNLYQKLRFQRIRIKNGILPRIKLSDEERRKRKRECDKRYSHEKRIRLKGYKAQEYRIYRMKFPQKVKAQQILNAAKRRGKIEEQPCYVCGYDERVVAHHQNYRKPLEVIWLCEIHHKAYHLVGNGKNIVKSK